ncbi:tRNA epoxyqueuosine(34) reductase QueG [Desertibaculum subflavum]|uniref:tRNA epoxyqueuosine(34) reductase QueG n=1 Tax=Desertibaculum subflavum TaxID=2268458 RepID=UPI000E665903
MRQPGRAPPDPKTAIRDEALRLGFDAVGFTRPAAIGEAGARFREFLADGMHGDMGWLEAKADRRRHPNALWPEARSVVMLGMNYGPEADPLPRLAARERAVISVYAQGRDYHDVVKSRLKALGQFVAGQLKAELKVFVDTAPVMEKPLAEAAGIGWQGKHTNLVSRGFGSWLFLGAMFTTLELEPDAPESDHCGQCRACLDICPTAAFPAPYRLDARRCISYLTIEHAGPIPREFRAAIGNRIYGCDDCLAICPWNKFARRTREAALKPRPELAAPALAELAELDDAAFRRHFAGTAIKRSGRDRFLRNVAIALGNSGATAAVPVLRRLLDDTAPLVRGAAIWGYARLVPPAELERERAARLPGEGDPEVRQEWLAA